MKRLIKKIIRAFLCLWAFLLFIPNVNAVTGNPNLNGIEYYTAPAATFLDNTNESLTTLSTSWNNTGKYYSADLSYSGGATAGGNINITTLEPVVQWYTYALSIAIGSPVGFHVSTKRVCIAENLSNNIYRWEHHNPGAGANWCVTPSWTDQMSGVNFNIENSDYPNTISYTILYYVFQSNITARSLMVSFNADERYTTTTIFGGYKLQLLTDNSAITQQQIQSAVQNSGLATANSVNQVQSSINQVQQELSNLEQTEIQNTQDIINSAGSNTQSIIDNQNDNTQQTIDSQKVCKYIDKTNIKENNKYLNSTGAVNSANGVGITDYINILSSDITIVSAVTGSANTCFYNSNKELISCTNLNGLSGTLTIPANSQYMRSTISVSQNKPTFNICTNGNQALNDNITDSSVDSSDDTLNSLKNNLPTNSVISDLLLLPVRLLQAIVNSLGGTCSTFSLGSLYGTELFMPCINLESYLGSTIWTFIDLVFSGMFILVIRKKFIQIWENITNLRGGGNEVD